MASGRGKSCGLAWLQPLSSIQLLSFPALGSHCPTVVIPGPLEMLDEALFPPIPGCSGCAC